MIEDRELYILKKSILMLNELSTNPESVYSGRDYISIHSRNLATINKIAVERNSVYMKELLSQYPKIKTIEVDVFIKNAKNEVKIFFLIGNRLYSLLDSIVTLIQTRGSTSSSIHNKIIKIEAINGKLLQVIENPYLEELYSKDSTSNNQISK